MVSFMKVIVNMLILTDNYLSAILYGAIKDCAYSRIFGQFHSLYMYTIQFCKSGLSKQSCIILSRCCNWQNVFASSCLDYAYVHFKLIEAIGHSAIAMFKQTF